MAAVPLDLCEVLYDWAAETEHDLSLRAGETIEILEKNDHGWWLGIVQRNGSVHRGYFPKNYVKEKVRLAPAPPPRPQDLRRADSDVTDTAASVQKVSISSATAPQSPPASTGSRVASVRRSTFSLRSLQAFDDLTERGFAVEIAAKDGATGAPAGAARANVGDRVEVQIVGLIWDGASTDTREFSRGLLKFPIGQRLAPVGLETALLQYIYVGQSATITCAPATAYGPAGNPPHVPPNSFVIFHVHFIAATPSSGSAALVVEGPAEFFASGVATVRGVAAGASDKGRRDSRIMLVPAGSSDAGSSGAAAEEES